MKGSAIPEWQGTRRQGRLLAFVAYAWASLVSVGLLGAVLLNGYPEDAVSQGRDHGLAQAAVIGEMAVAPALDGADLSAGLTAGQRTGCRARSTWPTSTAR